MNVDLAAGATPRSTFAGRGAGGRLADRDGIEAASVPGGHRPGLPRLLRIRGAGGAPASGAWAVPKLRRPGRPTAGWRIGENHASMGTNGVMDPNSHDRFLLRQRIRPVVNQYEFSLPGEGGEGDGVPFCFVEQKRFKFKEDIRFYTDETKTTEVLRIKARQAFDPRARYDVTLPSGTKVGEIQKVFGESLIRSTYRLYDASGNEVAKATEKSLFVALLRRILGVVSDFGDWLPIPYHFVFTRGEQVLGSHSRRATFRDTYAIDFSEDPQRTVDRRLVLAIAVGMDALQAR